jgi:hypothetical protein
MLQAGMRRPVREKPVGMEFRFDLLKLSGKILVGRCRNHWDSPGFLKGGFHGFFPAIEF